MRPRQHPFTLLAICLVVAACAPTVVPSAPPSASPPEASPSAAASPVATASAPVATLPEGAWTLLTPSGGPAARSGHTWTPDPAAAAAYLFGGAGADGVLGDTWVYDLGSDAWTAVAPGTSGPPPRSGHGAVWTDALGLVIFGGLGADGRPLADMWSLDPGLGTWRQVQPSGETPAARSGACLSLGPDGRLWLTHGLGDGGGLADTWAFDTAATSWEQRTPARSPGPDGRSGAGCWWSGDDRLVVHGGSSDGAPQADTWALAEPDGGDAAWEPVETGAVLPPRSDYAWSPHGDDVVLFGGTTTTGGQLSDVVVVSGADLAATSYAPAVAGPGARAGAALVDDPAAERMLLFGGAAGGAASGEVWQLDPP